MVKHAFLISFLLMFYLSRGQGAAVESGINWINKIGITICFIIPVLLLFVLIRNEKVYKFRMKVNDMQFNYNVWQIEKEHKYLNPMGALPDYGRMLYSFKKLTLENYLPASMIEELMKCPDNLILYLI